MVLFALLLPLVLLPIGTIVITVGSWHTHARKLQTKADAAAFAGGDVWQFPCVESTTPPALTSSQTIAAAARQYFGVHTQADGTPYTTTTFNAQVGGIGGNRLHVVLNGSNYWSDSLSPADISDGSGAICASEHLDVKATEDDSPDLFRLKFLFVDIKRKARVEIHQVEGLNGLLPISVRVPKPLSAAAVFYDESTGNILPGGIKYFCELASPPAGFGTPSGLGAWTTYNTSDPTCSYTSWANVNITDHTGVLIGTSFQPRCDASASPPVTTNCLSSSFTNINSFCQQGSGRTVQCFYATGTGTSQTAQSGLQYIRGYSGGNVTNGPPELRGAWLDTPSANCGGSITATSAYFNDPNGSCSATLNTDIDFGNALNQTLHPGAAADVKYGQVYGTTVPNGEEKCANNQNSFDGQNRPNCDMSGSSSASASVVLDPHFSSSNGNPTALRHAFALRVRLKNTTVIVGGLPVVCGSTFSALCQWFYTDNAGPTGNWPSQASAVDTLVFNNPVQRSFTGDLDSTGPIRWLRLTSDKNCDGLPEDIDAKAASQTVGSAHCFYLDVGLKGAIAQDQDEPAFGFNVKGSQSGSVDCDPNLVNWKDEAENGCSPLYAANDFTRDPPCPWPDGTKRSWNQFMSPPAPYDTEWPPYTCMRADGPPSPGQVEKGLKGRFFGSETATTCPTDSPTSFVKGRNYWDDDNNASGGLYAFADQGVHPNHLRSDDPRLVTLFMSTYDSFTNNGGGEVYPIVSFGSFYITGFGAAGGTNGLTIDDPCPGSTAPPDLVVVSGGSGAEYLWGHFINYVVPAATSTASEKLCAPGTTFMPCVPVLVE
jgi:hypothetical protein